MGGAFGAIGGLAAGLAGDSGKKGGKGDIGEKDDASGLKESLKDLAKKVGGRGKKPGGGDGDTVEPGMDRLPSYKKGGRVAKTGPALLHKGERVITARKARKMGRSGGR